MSYRIGQVLYVLLNRETKICPVQVVEEIIKKTLSGETTTYVVKAGKNSELVSLSDIDGQVFESIETLRKVLHDKVIKTVDNIILTTTKKAAEWYHQPGVLHHSNVESNETINVEDDKEKHPIDDAMIMLADGTVARVRGPFPGM